MDKEKMDVRELTEKELEMVSGGSSTEPTPNSPTPKSPTPTQTTPKPTHEPPVEKRK